MKHILTFGVVAILLLTPTFTFAEEVYDASSSNAFQIAQDWRGYYGRGSSEMQRNINALPSTPVQSVSIPILFGVALNTISPNFGDPRSGGRKHEGEDMLAPLGTPIVSPTDAVVLRTGVGPSEGNYVYTANPSGETFVYMHLDRIGEGVNSGVVLKRGSLIGYVGDTGNAKGGAAHLHFEIHNSSGTPVDPFPRLTSEFSLQEKMTALTSILIQTSDRTGLAHFLASKYKATFTAALTQNVAVPQEIIVAMASVPTTSGTTGALPTGDLSVGSSGSQVTALQTYLIKANKGPAAGRLKTAGATGYFGEVTRTALFEFQTAVGIIPNGYYGAETRTYVLSHPVTTVSQTPGPTPSPTPTTAVSLPRDLSKNMTGEDVRTLQKLLNTKGFTVALSGAGSKGNETTFFGAATEAAVKKFQTTYSITANGVVGPSTRTMLLSL